MTFKAAAIQMCSGVDPEKNAASMARLVREAAGHGAIYVQTPEMTGAVQKDRPGLMAVLRDEDQDIIVKTGGDLARELSIHLHVGSTAILLSDGKIANRAFLFGPDGRKICAYDKIHMFDVDLGLGEVYKESATFQPGDHAVVADLPWGRMGLSICYDLRFPHLFRAYAKAECDFLAIPAAFTKTTGKAHWHVLLRARAIETGCYVFAPAQVGTHAGGRETYGHALIVGPWGEILADALEQPGWVMAEVDVRKVADARKKVPCLDHDRPFVLPPRR